MTCTSDIRPAANRPRIVNTINTNSRVRSRGASATSRSRATTRARTVDRTECESKALVAIIEAGKAPMMDFDPSEL